MVKVVKQVSHGVYTGRPLHMDLKHNMVRVGDAVGHVKANTSGSVVMGANSVECW